MLASINLFGGEMDEINKNFLYSELEFAIKHSHPTIPYTDNFHITLVNNAPCFIHAESYLTLKIFPI